MKIIKQLVIPDRIWDQAYIEYVFRYFLLQRKPHANFDTVLAMPSIAMHHVASVLTKPALVIFNKGSFPFLVIIT